MTYLKATAIGVLVGLLAAMLWVVGILYWAERAVGDIHISFTAGPMLLVALIGFIAGFFWSLRGTRR